VPGQSCQISMGVKNYGTSPAGAFTVEFFFDSHHVADVEMPGLSRSAKVF
jgi:hypothetical protein